MFDLKQKNTWIGLLSITFMTSCLTTRTQLRENGQIFTEGAHLEQPEREVGAYVVDELKAEVSQLMGRLDTLEQAQKDELPFLKQKNDETLIRLNKLEQQNQAALEVIQQLTDRLQAAEDQVLQAYPEQSWTKAMQAFQQGEYEKALTLLNPYLQKGRGKNIQSAWFLKGMCHYKLKKFKKAILDFSQFQEKFPRAPRIPEVLYHIGLSFEALGLKGDAQGFYQELAEKYPDSPEVKTMKANASRESKKLKKK